jgi:hypothetical protein
MGSTKILKTTAMILQAVAWALIYKQQQSRKKNEAGGDGARRAGSISGNDKEKRQA